MTGKVAGVDPQAFKIINGKLYLNWNTELADKFEADASKNITKGDTIWQKLTHKR